MGIERDTDDDSIRRWGPARFQHWVSVGFTNEEALEMTRAGIRVTGSLGQRLQARRTMLVRDIQDFFDTDDVDFIRIMLEAQHQLREGDIWDFIIEHYY